MAVRWIMAGTRRSGGRKKKFKSLQGLVGDGGARLAELQSQSFGGSVLDRLAGRHLLPLQGPELHKPDSAWENLVGGQRWSCLLL